ncbi:hypothetical protein [Corynebacterium sp. HMSC27B11]|uniref:hypothetical protein n=1 Tax=Corynebacterium sp. HMSC27B11 TaxID=1581065 RepID=UPI001FF04FCC|nr:hypothetical protein [Corynebacterium sp. HMSC27B11]
MKDPTRIPGVMQVLQQAWEAQPELSFAEFFARLEPLGVARNSSDEELLAALQAELAVHPWSFEPVRAGAGDDNGDGDGGASGDGAAAANVAASTGDATTLPRGGASPEAQQLARVELAANAGAPERIATIGGGWVVIRPARFPVPDARPAASSRGGRSGASRRGGRRNQRGSAPPSASLMQPVMWEYEAVLRCRPGEPLRLRSAQGSEHRLGLVRRITVLDLPAQPEGMRSLGGLQHSQLGGREYILSFESGATALVGRQLWLTHIARREVAHEFLRWRVLSRAEVGSPLAYRPPRGEGPGRAAATELNELGAITRILPI